MPLASNTSQGIIYFHENHLETLSLRSLSQTSIDVNSYDDLK